MVKKQNLRPKKKTTTEESTQHQIVPSNTINNLVDTLRDRSYHTFFEVSRGKIRWHRVYDHKIEMTVKEKRKERVRERKDTILTRKAIGLNPWTCLAPKCLHPRCMSRRNFWRDVLMDKVNSLECRLYMYARKYKKQNESMFTAFKYLTYMTLGSRMASCFLVGMFHYAIYMNNIPGGELTVFNKYIFDQRAPDGRSRIHLKGEKRESMFEQANKYASLGCLRITNSPAESLGNRRVVHGQTEVFIFNTIFSYISPEDGWMYAYKWFDIDPKMYELTDINKKAKNKYCKECLQVFDGSPCLCFRRNKFENFTWKAFKYFSSVKLEHNLTSNFRNIFQCSKEYLEYKRKYKTKLRETEIVLRNTNRYNFYYERYATEIRKINGNESSIICNSNVIQSDWTEYFYAAIYPKMKEYNVGLQTGKRWIRANKKIRFYKRKIEGEEYSVGSYKELCKYTTRLVKNKGLYTNDFASFYNRFQLDLFRSYSKKVDFESRLYEAEAEKKEMETYYERVGYSSVPGFNNLSERRGKKI